MTSLISDLAPQAREGKPKYESKSSDSIGKKKVRTYVKRQNLMLKGKINRNHDQATEISENTSTDTSGRGTGERG